MKPFVGLSLMREQEFLQAALPLFIKNEVEVLEWSFDTILYEHSKPEWMHRLLSEYAAAGKLIGHGVRFSMFDARWTRRQQFWLNKLKKEVKRYRYNHISEHFGFMSNTDFHKGAPLPVPLNKASLDIGIDRLRRIYEVAQVAVGVENLAFSFSLHEVKKQGDFLKKLVQPFNGFVLLDLHNIYCQSENFKVDMIEIVKAYPLNKVRELHVSGGSWRDSVYASDLKKVRRDTHDEPVPEKIFKVLPEVLKLCPNLQYVIFERMGDTLKDERTHARFRKDFLRIKSIVHKTDFSVKKQKSGNLQSSVSKNSAHSKPAVSKILLKEQRHILKALRGSLTPTEVLQKIDSTLVKDWKVEQWRPSMIETALDLMRKWD